jgi:hypothetical protein
MIYNILKNRNMSKKEEKKDKKVFYIEEKIKTNIFYNIFVALNEFEINMKLYQFYNTKLNKYNLITDFLKDFNVLSKEYLEEYILQYGLPENNENIKINIVNKFEDNYFEQSIKKINTKLIQILNYLKNNSDDIDTNDNIISTNFNLKYITNKIINLANKKLYLFKLEC